MDSVYYNTGNRPVKIAASRVPCASLLDIGCGAGANALAWSKEGISVDGITFSQAEAAICSQFCREVMVHNLELGLPSVQKRYDVIVCSHILEHLAHPDKLLLQIHNSFGHAGGALIVALPNFLFITNRIKMLFGIFSYSEHGLCDKTHLRWFTARSARELVESAGFRIVEELHEGWVPMPGLRKILPSFLSTRIDLLFTHFFPGAFANQFVFRCEKR